MLESNDLTDISGMFVVVTEDGSVNGYDSCGANIWTSHTGRVLVNASISDDSSGFGAGRNGPRMIPSMDGSLYVMFPSDQENDNVRIAHVNASIMSVVDESPFSTPAFPNAYLTGSKVQSFGAVDFSSPNFTGWRNYEGGMGVHQNETNSTAAQLANSQNEDILVSATSTVKNRAILQLKGRKLIYSINEWSLSCIDTASQKQRWTLSYSDFPPLSSAHLSKQSVEYYQVERLKESVRVLAHADKNLVSVSVDSSVCGTQKVSVPFNSSVVGVYALLDASDTEGNLSLVLVAQNAPIPTNYGGLPEGYFFSLSQSIGDMVHWPGRTSSMVPESPAALGYSPEPIATHNGKIKREISLDTPLLLLDYEQMAAEFKVVDFLWLKFSQLSYWEKMYLVVMFGLLVYLMNKVVKFGRRKFFPSKQTSTTSSTPSLATSKSPSLSLSSPRLGASSIAIHLPDGTSFHQQLPDAVSMDNGAQGGGLASPAAGNSNRLMLIPSEAIHPYEVVLVGQSDNVQFDGDWQSKDDVELFSKKIKEISSRLTKLPFSHSTGGSANGYHSSPRITPATSALFDHSVNLNQTVIFLGRNVDEPRLVFRNPRAEWELQRANIPVLTQSIRNAVAASAIKDVPGMHAYVPKAVCGIWNTFQGVFQEYIKAAAPTRSAAVDDENGRNNSTTSVSIASFTDFPQSALDVAFLVLLLRDTDAHEGNYVRDFRRKVALYDLGCSLADRPIPDDPIERMCLDNFEIWKRLGWLLDTLFEPRHLEFLNKIDFETLKTNWAKFTYNQSLIDYAENIKTRLVSPVTMIRVMEMNANFIKACISANRTMLFAAEIMFGGLYDDVWLQVGEAAPIDLVEAELLKIPISEQSEALCTSLSIEKGRIKRELQLQEEDEINAENILPTDNM